MDEMFLGFAKAVALVEVGAIDAKDKDVVFVVMDTAFGANDVRKTTTVFFAVLSAAVDGTPNLTVFIRVLPPKYPNFFLKL